MKIKATLGIILTSVLTASALTFAPITAVADEGSESVTTREVSVPEVSPLPEPEILNTLEVQAAPISENTAQITVTGNVAAAPVDSPVTVIDADSFERLSTCVDLADCAVSVDKTAHPRLQAVTNVIQSQVIQLSEPVRSPNLEPNPDAWVPEETDPKGETETTTDNALRLTLPPSPPVQEAPIMPAPELGLDRILLQDETDETPPATSSIVDPVTGWGAELTITNPVFFWGNETYGLSAESNQPLDNTGYGLYVFDITHDTLVSSSDMSTTTYSYNMKFLPPEETRNYQAFIATWSTSVTHVADLTNIQVSSGVVTAYLDNYEIDLMLDGPSTFTTAERPYLIATTNYDLYFSYGARIYILDETANTIVAYSGQAGTAWTTYASFISGGPHTYKAVVAFDSSPMASTADEVTNIIAESDTITLTRAEWEVSLSAENATFAVGTSATLTIEGNQPVSDYYRFYLIDADTEQIVSSYYYGYSWDGLTKSESYGFSSGGPRTYKAVIAGANYYATSYNDLTDIQAESDTVTIQRLAWTLKVTVPVALSFTMIGSAPSRNLEWETNQYIPWSDYLYVLHILGPNGGSWGTGTGVGYIGGYGHINVPLNFEGKPVTFETYIGKPILNSNGFAIGVTDIQAYGGMQTTQGPWLDPQGVYNALVYGGSNPSADCAQACAGDPINAASGKFWEENIDLSMANVGIPLQFVRSYATEGKDTNDNGLGYGFRHNYNMKVITRDVSPYNGQPITDLTQAVGIYVVQENGSEAPFARVDDQGTFIGNEMIKAKLEYSDQTDTFTFTRENGAQYVFDAVTGRLLTEADAFGNTLVMQYNIDGTLHSVNADNGNFIQINWTNGEISSVEDNAGYVVDYTYQYGRLLNVSDNLSTVKEYEYDPYNRITLMRDAEGGEVVNEYDGNNRVISQTNELGGVTTFSYTTTLDNYPNNSYPITQETVITNPSGGKTYQKYIDGIINTKIEQYETSNPLTWTYEYDDAHNLLKTTNPDSSYIQNTYDSQNHMTATQNELGKITTFSNYTVHDSPQTITTPRNHQVVFGYDSKGSLISTTNPLGKTNSLTVNPNSSVASQVTPSGVATIYTYDPYNNVATVETDANGVNSYTYDDAGRVLTATDEDGNTITYTYDARGNVLTASDPENKVTTYTYDDASRILTITDSGNNVIAYTYNAAGQPLTETDPSNNVTTNLYNSSGQLTSVTDVRGKVSEFEYDPQGNLVLTRDPLGNETTYQYNWQGKQTKKVLPSGKEYENVYNSAGQIVQSFDPDDNLTSYAYDNDGNLITVVDPGNNTVTYSYDAAGQLTSVTRPDNSVLEYEYNDDGKVVHYTDAADDTAVYAYNTAGQLASTSILGVSNTFEYNTIGEVSRKYLQDGSYVDLDYDSRGNLTGLNYSDPAMTDISYTYDDFNRKASMVDGTGTTSYTYDLLNRPVTVTKPGNKTTTYGYDAANLTSMTYPSGEVVQYAYDDSSRLVSVDSDTAGVFGFAYNVDDLPTQSTAPNGVIEDIEYNNRNMLSGLSYKKGTAALQQYSYTYNNQGLLTNEDATLSTSSTNKGYSFDALLRLANTGYSFDAQNNMTSSPAGDLFTYDTNNMQLTDLDNSGANKHVDFSYDIRGNRISEVTTTASAITENNNFVYNQANQLVQANLGANPPPGLADKELNYTYDGSGLLVNKATTDNTGTVPSTSSETYIWDEASAVPSLLEDGKYTYIYAGGGAPLAQIDKATNEVTYLHTDSLGSVTLATDENGAVLTEYDYSDYGQQTAGDRSVTHFGYAGEYLDTDTGYYYLRARWYDPETAQFTRVDPALSSTMSPYGYTAGNPLQYTDPLGLASDDAGQAFLGALDGLTMGISTAILNWLNPGAIDPCSSAFTASSGVIGFLSMFIPVGGPIKALLGVGTALLKGAAVLGGAVHAVSAAVHSVPLVSLGAKLAPVVTSVVGHGGGLGHAAAAAASVVGTTRIAAAAGKLSHGSTLASATSRAKWLSEAQAGKITYLSGTYSKIAGITKGFRDGSKLKEAVEIHHMPMKSALRFGNKQESYQNGPSILIRKSDHLETRTWGTRATALQPIEAGLSTEDVIRLDIQDLLSTAGGKQGLYNDSIRDFLDFIRPQHNIQAKEFGL